MKRIIMVIFILLMNFSFAEGKKIGISFAGGGAKGFAHIGVLKVIEEEKIPIELVSGTSMGAIIGGLYAMGYTADELEKFAVNIDWLLYFDDNFEIEKVPFEEKDYQEKYLLTLELKNWSIKVPAGLLKGQKIEQLIKIMVWDAKYIRDFSKLPRSFIAISTDIETGEQVILNKGDLGKALRASMAIPSIFDPVDYNGKLLVDGMLVNNFPVDELRDIGADIVIGVDVAENLLKKDKLTTMASILNQSLSFKSFERTLEQRKKSDILILPDLNGYGPADYNKAQEIIDRGEEAARKVIKKLRELKNEEKFIEINKKSIIKNDYVYIEKMDLSQVDKNYKNLVKSTLDWNLPKILSKYDINDEIEKIYNTSFFNKVNYEIYGSNLKIIVDKNEGNSFNLGLRYDSEQDAAVVFNTTFKNLTTRASKTFVDIKLSEYPQLMLDHYAYRGVRNKFGINFMIKYYEQLVYVYEKQERVEEYKLRQFDIRLALSNVLWNKAGLSYGIDYHFLDAVEGIGANEGFNEYFYNYALRFKLDKLDKTVFSKTGKKVELKIILGDSSLGNKSDFRNFTVKFDRHLVLSKKLSFGFGGDFLKTKGEDVPTSTYGYLGGEYQLDWIIPFIGLKPTEIYGKDIALGRLSLQYEVKKERYLIFQYNYLKNNSNSKETNFEEDLFAYAIVFGAETMMGPVIFKVSKAERREVYYYLGIGYNF